MLRCGHPLGYVTRTTTIRGWPRKEGMRKINQYGSSSHLIGHGGINALLHHSLELVHVVRDTASGTAAGEGRADDERVPSNLSRNLEGLLHIVGSACESHGQFHGEDSGAILLSMSALCSDDCGSEKHRNFK